MSAQGEAMTDLGGGTVRVNGEDEPLSAATLAELIEQKSITTNGRGIAVAFNGAVVRRPDWANTPLRDGDVVEIVLARQGG
jgi:sulfur carrier protein